MRRNVNAAVAVAALVLASPATAQVRNAIERQQGVPSGLALPVPGVAVAEEPMAIGTTPPAVGFVGGLGRAWFRDQYSYEFKVTADGSFTIPEVLPGKYSFFVSVAQGYLGSGSDSTTRSAGEPQIASASMKLAVSDVMGDSGAPVDLGDIILTAAH